MYILNKPFAEHRVHLKISVKPRRRLDGVNIYTMRQQFSHFFNPIFFHDANVFDMRFIGRVLHNFTLHDNSVRFSYLHGLPCDVEEIMQITCPAFHMHPMSSKFAFTDSYVYQTK